MQSLSHSYIVLQATAPDVGAAGVSLCSGVSSLHEAAADGKHGARTGSSSRFSQTKLETHMAYSRLMHR